MTNDDLNTLRNAITLLKSMSNAGQTEMHTIENLEAMHLLPYKNTTCLLTIRYLLESIYYYQPTNHKDSCP